MNTSKVTENFLRYVKIDTQSREEFADHVPSTEKQRNLAKLLYQELLDMGAITREEFDAKKKSLLEM